MPGVFIYRQIGLLPELMALIIQGRSLPPVCRQHLPKLLPQKQTTHLERVLGTSKLYTLRQDNLSEFCQNNEVMVARKTGTGCTVRARLNHQTQSNSLKLRAWLFFREELARVVPEKKKQLVCSFISKVNTQFEGKPFTFGLELQTGILRVSSGLRVMVNSLQKRHLDHISSIVIGLGDVVGDLLPSLLDNIGNIHPWTVYKQNSAYLPRMQGHWNKLMEIRDILGLSHINLHDYAAKRTNTGTPTETEQLTHQFITSRQWILGNKRQGIKPEELFYYSQEGKYIEKTPLSVDLVLSQYPTKFNKLFFEIKQSVQPGDNPFIFNTIHIKEPTKVVLEDRIAGSGGVGELRRVALNLAYIGSDHIVTFSDEKPYIEEIHESLQGKVWIPEQAEQGPQGMRFLFKKIVIKSPKNFASRSKITHEKRILQHFRTCSSPYFLKYYHSTQADFEFRQSLLMDDLGPHYTLKDLSQNYGNSVFLHSRMYLFLHLARAIVAIGDHGVTHLDISLNNVCVGSNLLIKLIDFGESYHPVTCYDNYRPGFTRPSCPPEVFSQKPHFCTQSDIFSYGMVLFRTIFGRYPFELTDKLLRKYGSGTYYDHLLLSPEEISQCGFPGVQLILLQIVARCWQVLQERRPLPHWLFIMISRIYTLVQ